MSKNTWISVGVGIVAAAVGFFTFGTGYAALFAFSLGATATSLVLGPSEQKGNGALRPDEFQMNQSAEDITVPVIFGTSRVAANFIFVDFDNFESEAIYQEAQGGKGGGGSEKQQVGYTYTVPLSYGLCMGEIDRLRRVISSPGLDVWKKFPDEGLAFTSGPETFDCEFVKEDGDITYKEGGTCTFYPGGANQGSNLTTEDDNHRHFCWVDFPVYTMTGSAAPRSLLFEITRMPQVLDDDGDPIASFPVRAAEDDTVAEWLDANPAAVAWEVLQNPIWGKGASVADLDVESFRTAANYYQRKRIGISTAMGRTSLNEFMGRLRDIFGLWVWWDGSKMRCRCIHDRDNAYAIRTRITAEDVVGSPSFNRPSLSGTYNELRLEFTNRESNWQREVATAMDLAHVETIEGVRTQSIDAAEIGTRRAAELLAHAMLRQIAYPGAACTLRLRRTYSGLQPGSFVELVWDEWRESGAATTYWRVVSVVDDDQGTEGLTVNLAEDIYATARDGEVGGFDEPIPTIDEDDPLETDDLNDGDLFGDRSVGSLSPVFLWEPNSWASQLSRRILVAPTREKRYVQSVSLAWRKYGDSQTTSLGTSKVLPINGKLASAISANGPLMNRGAAYEFQVELYHADQAARFEGATGLVQDDADDFAELLRKLQAVALIDGEIFRIGWAEETSPGILTVRTYMRGELGSSRAAHALNAPVLFFATFSPSVFTDATGIPTTQKVVVTLKANSTVSLISGEEVTTIEAPEDGLGIKFDGTSVKPFAPELVSATRVGTTWTVRIRPRVNNGAGFRANIEDDLTNYVTSLSGLDLKAQKSSGGAAVTVPAGTSFNSPPFDMPTGISVDKLDWQADDGSAAGGIIKLVVTFDSNPASLKIWGVRNGFQSPTSLDIPQP